MKRLTVNEAVEALKCGKLVVVPTETVYGLAVDGLNDAAVSLLYEIKGRPLNKPIMLQVADIDMMGDIVEEVPLDAKKLMEAFWPGPLSLVFKKQKKISEILSAGTDTIGIRMPDQPLTLSIIKTLGRPLAVPSANLSGMSPPKTPLEVEAQLEGLDIVGIVDAGACEYGVASTIVDMSTNEWRVLRTGVISEDQIRAVLEA